MAQLKSFRQVIVESFDRELLFEILDQVLPNMVKDEVIAQFNSERNKALSNQMEIGFIEGLNITPEETTWDLPDNVNYVSEV